MNDVYEPELYYRQLSLKRVTTRKPHICNSCKKEIPVGSTIYKHAYLNDDMKFVSEYLHTPFTVCE